MAVADHAHDVAAWALEYLGRGWQPVAYPAGSKGPRTKDWPNVRYRPDEIPDAFGPGQNIGLLLGPASGGVVDADFDDPLALACALHFLPATPCSFGRPSKPRSHAFYLCEDVPTSKASLKFEDPDHGCLLELRAQSSQQTMCPPSMHPDGERLEWRRFEAPARVPYAEIAKAVRKSAAAALIAHRLGDGNRHGQMLLVAGALLRAMPKDAALPILEAAYHASGGSDWPDALRAIDDTAQRLASGERVTGRKRLAEEWTERVVKLLYEWLKLNPTEAKRSPLRGSWRSGGTGGMTLTEWLWQGYILRRALNELVGDAGLGKSSVLAHIAACVTTGTAWPDGQPNTLGPRNVVVLSAEDDFWGTILPRVVAAGGDRERLIELSSRVVRVGEDEETSEQFSIAMREVFDALCEDVRPALMIIDPLNSFIGADVKMVEANKVRPRLEELRDVATRWDVSVLWIRHERKGDIGRTVHRGSGIADITAVVRASLIALQDPEDEDVRYIAPAKSNLWKRMPTLPYHIENVDTLANLRSVDAEVRNVSRVVWHEPDERTARQISAEKKATREAPECVIWLHEQLAAGPKKVAEVHTAGRDRFARTLIERTAKTIGVVREGRGATATWRLPF